MAVFRHWLFHIFAFLALVALVLAMTVYKDEFRAHYRFLLDAGRSPQIVRQNLNEALLELQSMNGLPQMREELQEARAHWQKDAEEAGMMSYAYGNGKKMIFVQNPVTNKWKIFDL
jgi:hypothetical protein